MTQREVIERTRSSRLPPRVPRRSLGLLHFVLLGRRARARAAAAAAALTPRDVDAHLVEPDADLHLRAAVTQHGTRVAPVFALFHSAVTFERGGGHHDPIAVARFSDTVLQVRSAHAPEHGAASEVHAVDAAAHRGDRRGGLAPRALRRRGARIAVHPPRRLVLVLVLLRHLFRGVAADGTAR